ncbi:SDR family oxidoreductase [Dehalococcoidia bacterium]|nr:SDR family oxidoreductase [Dehalococcoidia bacterium]
MDDFAGKTTLVTGASRGIGKAIALEFAKRGSNIAFNYLRNHKAAVNSKKEIEALGVKCVALRAHLGDPDKIEEMFENISNEFNTLNFLINNAASGVQKRAVDLEPKHWDWAMNINARAPWLCSIKASELMPEGGSIVNITSEGSRTVLPYYLSIGTSKAALETLTRYLAVELAEKDINVNAISGGYIETDAFDSFPNKESMSSAGKKTLTGQKISVEDIARVAAFLCSTDAHMIRGQILVVDGGVTLTADL